MRHTTTVPYRGGRDQHRDNIEISSEGYLPVFQFFLPVLIEQSSVILIKGSRVREESCGQEHITNKSSQLCSKLLTLRCPSIKIKNLFN